MQWKKTWSSAFNLNAQVHMVAFNLRPVSIMDLLVEKEKESIWACARLVGIAELAVNMVWTKEEDIASSDTCFHRAKLLKLRSQAVKLVIFAWFFNGPIK